MSKVKLVHILCKMDVRLKSIFILESNKTIKPNSVVPWGVAGGRVVVTCVTVLPVGVNVVVVVICVVSPVGETVVSVVVSERQTCTDI